MQETSSVLAEVDLIMTELKRSMDQISEKSDETSKHRPNETVCDLQ